MADIEPNDETTIYRSTAELHVRQLTSKERSELLDLAIARAPDPSVFEGVEPFFFQGRASTSKVDSYGTWMADSSLKNYADDATDPGVQFQVSHNGRFEVGFGRSLRGKFAARSKEDRATLIDFCVMPGLRCGNMTSDEFILGARSGIYADLSIGFIPGEMICNICGNDWLRKWDFEWDDPKRCSHWPLVKYDVESGRGTKEVVCNLRVENSHLNETSTVYDGATPGAGIVAVDMARYAAATGQLEESDRQLLENLYRFRIDPGVGRVHGGIPIVTTKTEETKIDIDPEKLAQAVSENTQKAKEEVRQEEPAKTKKAIIAPVPAKTESDPESLSGMAKLRAKYAETRIQLDDVDDPHEALEAVADELLRVWGENDTLKREAEDGRQFREGLMADLDKSVVRAFGADGATERQKMYRTMAGPLDANGVKKLIADLEHKAGERFQGGRATRDDVNNDPDGDQTVADRKAERRGPTRPDLTGV